MWNHLGRLSLPECAQLLQQNNEYPKKIRLNFWKILSYPRSPGPSRTSQYDNKIRFLVAIDNIEQNHPPEDNPTNCSRGVTPSMVYLSGSSTCLEWQPTGNCSFSSCWQETLQGRRFSKHPPCWGHLAGSQDKDWEEFGLARCWQQVGKAEKCR